MPSGGRPRRPPKCDVGRTLEALLAAGTIRPADSDAMLRRLGRMTRQERRQLLLVIPVPGTERHNGCQDHAEGLVASQELGQAAGGPLLGEARPAVVVRLVLG